MGQHCDTVGSHRLGHIGIILQVLAVMLSTQLPANAFRKAVDNGSMTWVPAMWKIFMKTKALCFGLDHALVFRVFRENRS